MKVISRMITLAIEFILFSCAFSQNSFANELSSAVSKPSAVVIFNQVRGQSCCNPGSITNLEMQMRALKSEQMPATFAFRYDALLDKDMMLSYKKDHNILFESALFLEITPDLARDATVTFNGSEDQWYKAQASSLLGYTQGDRKQLIDTSMSAYFSVFHTYPKATVAWMIDAWSLSYLSRQYGVIAHEITREQWGTDSYTLYGGPMGGAYFPNAQWPLMPGIGKDALSLVMLRQTIPDPVWNYGDTTSSTTSQPNDYVLAGKSIAYFQALLTNALQGQSGSGFAVIGLENSMNVEHQREFVAQLRVVSELIKQSPNSIQTFSAKGYAQQKLQDRTARDSGEVLLYAGTNMFDDKMLDSTTAWWITTPYYRIRLLQKNNTFMMTDLRVYDKMLNDPYLDRPLSTPNAYWIVPFLMDGSRFRMPDKKVSSEDGTPYSDVRTKPVAIHFPNLLSGTTRIDVTRESQHLVLKYESADHEPVSLSFNLKNFIYDAKTPPVWDRPADQMPGSDAVSLLETREGFSTVFTPTLRTATPASSYTSPEENRQPVSLQHSHLFVSNRFALLNRNPIRVVITLGDEKGRATMSNTPPELLCVGAGCGTITFQHPDSSIGRYYLDILPEHAGLLNLKVRVDGQEKSLGYARFSLNCHGQWKQCITHPVELVGFMLTSLSDRLHHRQ